MQIAYVNVFVSDLDSSVAFYDKVLGLKLEHANAEHGYAALSAGSIRLGLAKVGEEQAHLAGRHTGVGLAVDGLVDEHKRLSELGVSFSMPPTRQPWGGFMAMFEDPDGNTFYLDEVTAMHAS